MKQLSLAVLLFVIASCVACAQSFSGGLRGGTNISWIFYHNKDNDLDRSSQKLNPEFGLFGFYKISERFGLQLEANYIEKGHLYLDTLAGMDNLPLTRWVYQLHYAGPCLLVKYNFPGRWGFGAGFSFVYLASAKYISSNGSPNEEMKNLTFTRVDKCLLFEFSLTLSRSFELNLRSNTSAFSIAAKNKNVIWKGFCRQDGLAYNEIIGVNLKYTIRKKIKEAGSGGKNIRFL